MNLHLKWLFAAFLTTLSFTTFAQTNVIDQVIWFVGDEPILKSDIEAVKLQMQLDGEHFQGDPNCFIPEQIAINKLYLHQAKIDSIDIPMANVNKEVERRISYSINQVGSVSKLEEYAGKSISEIRDDWRDKIKENQIIQEEQRKIIGTIKLTPADIRNYYTKIPTDSLPYIPTTVETQIMTVEPQVSLKAIDEVKAKLRDITDRVNKGESFATLAIIYSEDTESAKHGGELGFKGRAELVPEFSNAAFALTDPKKVSNIVQTEYGYHIIQLIEKKGDRANFRHILLKPKVTQAEIDEAFHRIDSVMTLIKKDSLFFDTMYKSKMFVPENERGKTMTFDDAVSFFSYDKETRNNKGIMVNTNSQSQNYGTPRFQMQDLPAEVAKAVDKLKIGEVSNSFQMIDPRTGKTIVAVVKLRNRIEGHKANMKDDYLVLKDIVEGQKRNEVLDAWVKKKIQNTNIRIIDGWRNCDFRYNWLKKK